MEKKFTRRILSIMLAVMMVLSNVVYAGEMPHSNNRARLGNNTIIDGIKINPKKQESYKNGDSIKFSGDWSLPNDSEDNTWYSGDSFSIELPDGLRPRRKETTLGPYGIGIYDEKTNSFIFKFTEEINYKIDRHGGFVLDLEIAIDDDVDYPIDLDIIFKEDGEKIVFEDTIKVDGNKEEVETPIPNEGKDWNRPIEELTSKGVYGGMDYYSGKAKWWARVNYGGKHTGIISVTDELGEYHRFVTDSVKVYKRYTNGYETYPAVKWNNEDKIDVTDEVVLKVTEKTIELTVDSRIVGYDIDGDAIVEWYELEYETEYDGTAPAGKDIVLTNSLKVNNIETEDKIVDIEYNTGGWGTATNQSGNAFIKKIDKDTGKPLEGATFKVTHGIYTSFSKEFVTNKDGIAEIKYDGYNTLFSGKYIIEEVKAPNGYKLNDKPIQVVFPFLDKKTEEVIITNEKDLTSIEVNKVWKGIEDSSERKDIKITLLADDEIERVVILKSNMDKYIFRDLPKTKDGKDITYTVKESYVNKEDAKYFDEPVIEKTNKGFTITNNRNNYEDSKNIDIKVTKEWKNITIYEDLPTIKLNLLANGKEVNHVILDDFSEYTFKDLPLLGDDNKEINYTIKEEYVDKVDSEHFKDYIVNKTDYGFHIVNEQDDIQSHFDIPVKLKYGCNKRPNVNLTLRANGEIVKEVELSEEMNFEYVFENLPLYSNGRKIDYAFDKIEIPGYDIAMDFDDIVNNEEFEIEAIPETIVVSLDKTDEHGKALSGATFGLYENIDGEDVLIDRAVSDEEGLVVFNRVENKDYIVKEISAPKGYRLNNTAIEIKKENNKVCDVNMGSVVNYKQAPTILPNTGVYSMLLLSIAFVVSALFLSNKSKN